MIETIEIVMTILAQILISLCWYKLGELKEGNRNRKDINKVFELTNSILETLDRNYKLKLILKETKIVSL